MNASCTPLTSDLDPRARALDLGGERVTQRRSLRALVVPRARASNLREQFRIFPSERAQLGDNGCRVPLQQVARHHGRQCDIERGSRGEASGGHTRTVGRTSDTACHVGCSCQDAEREDAARSGPRTRGAL